MATPTVVRVRMVVPMTVAVAVAVVKLVRHVLLATGCIARTAIIGVVIA